MLSFSCATITLQIDQKFEKFQIMPEALEFFSDVVSRLGAAGDDIAGIVVAEFIAGFVAATDAAVSFCGGINL